MPGHTAGRQQGWEWTPGVLPATQGWHLACGVGHSVSAADQSCGQTAQGQRVFRGLRPALWFHNFTELLKREGHIQKPCFNVVAP